MSGEVSTLAADAAAAPPSRSLLGLEAWATAAPLVCAVHCVAAPLLVAVAPRLTLTEAHERGLVAGSLVVAAATLSLGVRVHRRRAVWLPVTAGTVLWLLSRFLPPSAEGPVTVAASLLMAGGTFWSARLRHLATCRRCGCIASLPADIAGPEPAALPGPPARPLHALPVETTGVAPPAAAFRRPAPR
jgi:MerC mercury resistance protein